MRKTQTKELLLQISLGTKVLYNSTRKTTPSAAFCLHAIGTRHLQNQVYYNTTCTTSRKPESDRLRVLDYLQCVNEE